MRRLVPSLIALGLLLVLAQPAAAASTPRTNLGAAQARQAQLAQVRAQLGDAVASNLQAQDQLTQALAENRRQADALSVELDSANRKLAALEAEIASLDQRRAATEARIKVEKHQLDLLARALYVQPDSLMMSLAQAGSLRDAMTLVEGLQSASHRARSVQAQLDHDQASLTSDRERQEVDRRQSAALRDGLQAKQDRLNQLNVQQQAALADLQSKLASNQAELASVNYQSATTAAYIASALQASQSEATSAAYQAVWEQVQLLSGSSAPSSDATTFVNPLPGATLTQPFGPTSLPFEPPFAGYAHFHTGIDVSTAEGTPVHAAADGTVVLAGFNAGGYGNYVVIAHAGGLDTLYGHLDSIATSQGQHVARGQVIGTEGSTGNSTGAHLHFEVRRGGQPVDPATYLK